MKDKSLEILLVDDDEGHVELVRRNLRRGGILNNVTCFYSGKDALDFIFREGAYANREGNGHFLVLLDINMPQIDGVEVLRRIKADPVRKKIPVIMLTTTDNPREVERCYELGCSIYITKPVDPGRFIEAISRLGLFISIVSLPSEEGTS